MRSNLRIFKASSLPPLGVTDRAIMNALIEAVDRIASATTRFAVQQALDRLDIQAAIDAIRWDVGDTFLKSILPREIRDAYELAAEQTVARLDKIGVSYSFNLTNPRAPEFARAHAAELIAEFQASSKDGIARLIERAFTEGIPVNKLSRLIVEDGIGLTERQARAVLNFRRRLERNTELDLTDAALNAKVDRYAAGLLRYRSETIARTEVIRASREGTQEAWRQAIDEGLIDTGRYGQMWDAVEDSRQADDDVCPDLNGQIVPFGGQFVIDGEAYDGPPAHPNCRCSLTEVPLK